MTEAEWLACIDPGRLHFWVVLIAGNRFSNRKLKLFEVACCRQIWHIITDARCRRAIEVAERFADGMVSEDDLVMARSALRVRRSRGITTGKLALRVAGGSNIFSGLGADARELELRHTGLDPNDKTADAAAMSRQAGLYRDIVGNPFRPVALDPSWLSWNDGTVPKLAQAIYDDRRFGDLPIMADALEEAGCQDEGILAHCRGTGPHVRGCWVVDLILGKEGGS
jgi:hypothetical protein